MQTMILYATKSGAARRCAELLAEELPGAVLHDLSAEAPDIESADAVIIGSGIRNRHLHRTARRFLDANLGTLLRKNVALYLCGYYPDTHRRTIEKDLPAPLRQHALCIASLGGTPPFTTPQDSDWVSTEELTTLTRAVQTTQRSRDDLRTWTAAAPKPEEASGDDSPAHEAPAHEDRTQGRPGRRTVSAAAVEIGTLLAGHAGRIDAADAWQTPILPGDATDAPTWNETLATTQPRWITPLLVIRDRIVRLAGLHQARQDGVSQQFPIIASTDQEVITGDDDTHLNFRVSTRLSEHGTVVITTTVTIHNLLGRLYWGVVRFVHPLVVRSSLRVMRRAGS